MEWDAGMVTVMICGLGEFMNVSTVFMTEVNMNKPVRRHGSSFALERSNALGNPNVVFCEP